MNRVGAMAINLASLPRGARAVLTKIGGRGGDIGPAALAERMAAMGFVPGTELAVEANYGRGPIIVCIRGARVAIGRGQAAKLMVRPLLPEAVAECREHTAAAALLEPAGASRGDGASDGN